MRVYFDYNVVALSLQNKANCLNSMNIKIFQKYFAFSKSIAVLMFGLLFFSCKAPKFVYEHEGLSDLDFTKGKWILNKPHHINTTDDFYDESLAKWKELIKDSLYSLHDIRRNKLIFENIDFKPSVNVLKNIRIGTDCDYLITTNTEVLREQLSGVTVSPPIYGKTYLANEANVEVRIYDLRSGEMVAMRKAYGSIKEETSSEDKTDINTALPSDGIIRNGIDRIVDYFKKNGKSK